MRDTVLVLTVPLGEDWQPGNPWWDKLGLRMGEGWEKTGKKTGNRAGERQGRGRKSTGTGHTLPSAPGEILSIPIKFQPKKSSPLVNPAQSWISPPETGPGQKMGLIVRYSRNSSSSTHTGSPGEAAPLQKTTLPRKMPFLHHPLPSCLPLAAARGSGVALSHRGVVCSLQSYLQKVIPPSAV